MDKKKISIITPCYNEGNLLIDCCESIKKLFSNDLKDYNYEHIICDNSSKDTSQEILEKIANEDSNVKVIFNKNNYGSQRSIYNSLKFATGDAIVLYFPVDLQEPVNLIIDFVKNWEKGYDIVYGYIKKRNESLIMKSVRKFFYFLLNFSSNKNIPKNVSNYQLVDKSILKEMLNIDDKTPFVRVLSFSISDNHFGIGYEWQKRKSGKSKEFFNNLIGTAINGLISVGSPFRLILYVGLFISITAILVSIYSFIHLLFFRPNIDKGIPMLIVSLYFFSGVQLFVLGCIGEYLASINNQVRFKDKVVIKKTINFK